MNYPVDDLLARLIDPGTFRTWDVGPSESIVTAEGLIAGQRVAIAASDFSFAGGSIGLLAGERLTRAAERATEERLPLIALPASGGTRMQEGTPAFLQMIKVTAAVSAHKAAGLPYITYLRHPTTGGVLASWASLGHVTFAEPGALIGFLGPRVYEALEGHPFPAGVATAEHLCDRGIIDAVVPVHNLRARLAAVLAAFTPAAPGRWPASGSGPRPRREPVPYPGTDAWDNVLATRQRERPSSADLLREAAGAGASVGAGGGVLLGVGRVAGIAVAAAAQQGDRPLGISGLRLARRQMDLADRLGRAFVAIIDTPGAELSVAAEERGIAREIALCLARLLELPVPTVTVLLGQGTGGGALALLPADRVIAASRAWLAPLAPEGASAIVHRDTAHAAEMARAQSITAADLAAAGMVDQVVAEEGDWLAAVASALRAELADLTAMDAQTRLSQRMARVRALGT